MRTEQALQIVEEATHTYDDIAKHFSQTRFSAGPMLANLTSEVGDDATVLDIGCGNGRLVEVIPSTAEYVGIDVSEKLLSLAKEKFPEREFQSFDGVHLPFPDNSFTHIYMLFAFHHIPKPLQDTLVLECKRVLKKNGTAVFTIWHLWRNPFLLYAFRSLGSGGLFDMYIPWKDKDGNVTARRYFYMFTKNRLKALFKKVGFSKYSVEILHMKNQKNYLVRARR